MNFWDKILFWMGRHWPGKLFVKRFVSGDTMEDAFLVAENLNKDGVEAIINFLGEEVKERQQVWDNARIYSHLIREISCRKLRARVSVKPSQLGLKIDKKFYRQQLSYAARDALIYGIPLEIDMEAEDTVAPTIQETIYLSEYYKLDGPQLDLRQALAMNLEDGFVHLYNLTGAGIKVRLCRGAYPSKYSNREVAVRFLSSASHLFQHKVNPDFATHDLKLLDRIFLIRNELPAVCGFQFLLGLRKRLWKKLVSRKERVAVYVPFGTAWLPYAKRRWKYILKKFPSIISGN